MRIVETMQKYLLISAAVLVLSVGYSRQSASPTLIAVGDIFTCGNSGAYTTAGIINGVLKNQPDSSLAILGDIAYERGTNTEFKCFDAAWGEFKTRSYPVPGNHEYYSPNAAGYYSYYGTRAGDPKRGYYSYTLGAWRILALNSNCDAIGGCDTKSQQMAWIKKDLAANKTLCTLAYWHHPRFSSGTHGNAEFMQDIWAELAKAGVDLVLNAHDHTYERFRPLDSSGQPNAKGIRQFVIGTGGRSLYAFKNPNPNSVIKQNTSLGVGIFRLEPKGYRWEYKAERGSSFKDSGIGQCH